jgi:stress response protein YsnF
MYDDAAKAEKVVNEIVNAGINRDQVQVLSGNGSGTASVIDKLSEQGVEKDEAAVYAEAIGKGRSMVTVQAPDERADETFEMMNELGAQDLDELLAEARGSQEQEEAEETVPVVEEQVSIGKRKVMRGGVRVTSTVSERPVEETVRLREEKVEVEKTEADRKLSPQEAEKAFQQKTVELAETAEEAVISKEARVVEEVSLRKSAAEREETVQTKARRTDVKVEQLEGEEPQGR